MQSPSNPNLTVYDTGEMFEPHVHPDGSGNVDFDNDESATVFTMFAHPSKVRADTTLVQIDTMNEGEAYLVKFNEMELLVDEDGDVWIDGNPVAETAGEFICAECSTRDAETFVVTTLDKSLPKDTRTELCLSCHERDDRAAWPPIDTPERVKFRMSQVLQRYYDADDEVDNPTSVQDLLTDVQHLCWARGIDMDDVLERALNMAQVEREEWAMRDETTDDMS